MDLREKRKRRRTYIPRIYLAIKLIDADALCGISPVLTGFPHGDGLLEVVVACAEEPTGWIGDEWM